MKNTIIAIFEHKPCQKTNMVRLLAGGNETSPTMGASHNLSAHNNNPLVIMRKRRKMKWIPAN